MPKAIAPLSAKAVERLSKSAAVGGVPGLELTVSTHGAKSWRVYYRVAGGDGKRRALGLGRFPTIGLAEARKRANDALAVAADGRDPRLERRSKAKLEEVTLDGVLERYLAHCAELNAPATLRDKCSLLNLHALPHLKGRPAHRLSRADAMSIIDGIAAKAATKRKVHLYLNHFFEWAEERELIPENPLHRIKAPKPVAPRARVLSDSEIKALWAAHGVTADIARLLLLTAQRLTPIQTMRWDSIDVERSELRVGPAQMKSGRQHVVPLSAMALEIVLRQPRLSGPYVFGVGSDGARPGDGASSGMKSLRKQVDFADWRLHDLRRTAVTLAERARLPLDAIKALTQHKKKGVIGVYAQHPYEEEQREVAAGIADEICKTLNKDL